MRKNKYYLQEYGMGSDVISQATQTKDRFGNWQDNSWYSHQVDATIRGDIHRNDSTPILKGPGFPLSVPQKLAFERMRKKQDCFMGVPPAAGKTAPMKNAWIELFVNALIRGVPLNSPEFPRVLYVAKTKQLAMESILQNYQMWIYDLFASAPGIMDKLGLHGINKDTLLSRDKQNEVHQLVQEMTAIRIGGINEQVVKSSIFFLKPIIITTPIMESTSGFNIGKTLSNAKQGYYYNYKAVVDLINNYGKYFSMIVIDEFQQYLPMPGNNLSQGKFTEDTEKNFDMIFKVIKAAQKPGKCGIHLLTGTVNKNTAEQFCSLMNSELGRNFDPIIMSGNVPNAKGGTDFIGNRSNLTVVPLERMTTAQDKLKICSDIVKNKQSRSIMVIFSTRRSAPTGIFNLLNQLIRILPARDPKILLDEKVPENITVGQMFNKIDADQNFIDPEFNPNRYPEGMISSKDDLVKVDDIKHLQLFDVDSAEQQGDDSQVANKLLNNYNENNLLYQGVLRGIGVMIGKMDDRMKGTIQKLFRSRKIHLLLATD